MIKWYHKREKTGNFFLTSLPSAIAIALGKTVFPRSPGSQFAKCIGASTRQTFKVCRVLRHRHSENIQTSPSACQLALGEHGDFAECQMASTQRSLNVCRVPFRLALGKTAITGLFPGRVTLFCQELFCSR